MFMHDPDGGKDPWQRMTVKFTPAAPKKSVGGQSLWQMKEDLQIVAELAATPFSVPAVGNGAAAPVRSQRQAIRRLRLTPPFRCRLLSLANQARVRHF